MKSWKVFLGLAVWACGALSLGVARAQRFTTIDFPGSTRTVARWINPESDIAGFYDAGGTTHGFLRSKDGTLTPINFPDAHITEATSINPEGDIVGFYGADGGAGPLHAFLRTKDGEFTSFDLLGSGSTAA